MKDFLTETSMGDFESTCDSAFSTLWNNLNVHQAQLPEARKSPGDTGGGGSGTMIYKAQWCKSESKSRP